MLATVVSLINSAIPFCGEQRRRGRQKKRWIDTRRRTLSIILNGEGEPIWLTPYQRHSQPEGERHMYTCIPRVI